MSFAQRSYAYIRPEPYASRSLHGATHRCKSPRTWNLPLKGTVDFCTVTPRSMPVSIKRKNSKGASTGTKSHCRVVKPTPFSEAASGVKDEQTRATQNQIGPVANSPNNGSQVGDG